MLSHKKMKCSEGKFYVNMLNFRQHMYRIPSIFQLVNVVNWVMIAKNCIHVLVIFAL